jgi:hypothetical protein
VQLLREKAVIGFGLDLSGYTTNKTSLAAIIPDGEAAEAVLLRKSAFAIPRTTDMLVQDAVEAEARDIKRCLDIGPLAVDIPIDLQHLLAPDGAVAIWELTRRPVDKKFGAMAPLADRIGAPVARFSAIMRKANLYGRLGEDLFETYPAEILRRLEFAGNYKLRDSRKEQERRLACEALCRFLVFDRALYDDDDLDAIICALAAVAPDDSRVTAAEFDLGSHQPPLGFRILKRNPFAKIAWRESDFATWIASRRPD